MAQKEVASKPNILRRFGAWMGRSWSEFKKVNWPTFPVVMKNLGVVLVIVTLFLVIIGAIDAGLLKLFELLTGTGTGS